MTLYAYQRGHEMYYDEGTEEWKYSDTGEVADHDRPCKRCGCLPTIEGHDHCVGSLRGVKAACCGHGVDRPYVYYYHQWFVEYCVKLQIVRFLIFLGLIDVEEA